MTQNLQLGQGRVCCRAAGQAEECSLLSGSSCSTIAQRSWSSVGGEGPGPMAPQACRAVSCSGAWAWAVGQVDPGHLHMGAG